MRKLMLLIGVGIGYILGAKAGRERYEQISRQAQKIRSNPTVQQKVDEAKHVAKDAADTATEKVRSESDSTSESTSTTYSDPAPGTTGTTGSGFGRGDEGA